MKQLLLSVLLVGNLFTGKAQNQDVPLNGLVGFYKLEGNGGDSSGMSNHGTSTSTPAVPDRFGHAGKASYFNGTSSMVLIPTNASLQPGNSVTMNAWIKPDTTTLGWSTVISKRFSVASDPWNSYTITTFPGSPYYYKWCLGISKGIAGTLQMLPAKTFKPLNNWLFVSASYDGSLMKLYLNGVLDTTMAYSGNIGYSPMGVYIGFTGTGVNDYFKGIIDDVTIYNRALTATEVATMYNGTVGIASAVNTTKQIGLYPNPANNELIIDHEGVTFDHVVITDLSGKRVMESIAADHLDISDLSKGVYLLNLQHQGEAVSGTLKFVKN